MKRTLREWFSFYEKKTHERHINPEGYQTLFDDEKGYCQFSINGTTLKIHECCGDGVFWCRYAFSFAEQHNLQKIITICTRNIMPYIRRMGGCVVKKEIRHGTNNGFDIYGEAGRWAFRCFPAWWNKNTKRNAYCIICEVKNEI